MGEHSKGPWTVDKVGFAGRLEVLGADGFVIADVVQSEETEANAALLAAAPQLLDHLQRWHVAAHPRGDDSCETCQFLKSIGQPITTP